jgi:hypothetical protein
VDDISVHKQRLAEAKTKAARQRTLVALKKRLVKRHHHEDEIATLRTKIRRLRRDLHQHGRKVRTLELRLERAQARVGDPSICFGSKKMFRRQFQLAENGYANHEQWLEDWRDARRSGFALVGAASVPAGNEYARMLSSFAYASFDAALASACCRSGVWLRRVEPAFTSLIGRTCFATRYGLTTHAAAALAIARRAMGLSERMPKPVGGELKLPLDGGGHVTLPRPARIGGRHVWSSWKKLNDGWKSAHVARGRTGRKSRSPAGPTASPPGRSTASRRGNYPPSSVGLGSGVPS